MREIAHRGSARKTCSTSRSSYHIPPKLPARRQPPGGPTPNHACSSTQKPYLSQHACSSSKSCPLKRALPSPACPQRLRNTLPSPAAPLNQAKPPRCSRSLSLGPSPAQHVSRSSNKPYPHQQPAAPSGHVLSVKEHMTGPCSPSKYSLLYTGTAARKPSPAACHPPFSSHRALL